MPLSTPYLVVTTYLKALGITVVELMPVFQFDPPQGGNNNPCNQDNETSWLDWNRLKDNQDMFRFFKLMIAFRKAHPSVSRSRFWREDVQWFGVGQAVDMSGHSHSLAVSVCGQSQQDDDIYFMVNAGSQAVAFTMQDGGADDWKRVIDTGLESPDDFCETGREGALRWQCSCDAHRVEKRKKQHERTYESRC